MWFILAGQHQGCLQGETGDAAPQTGRADGHGGVGQHGAQHPPPLTVAAATLFDNDMRISTKAHYKSKVKGFTDYCAESGTNPKTCHPNGVLNFLTGHVRDKGCYHQTICGYRSDI